MKKLALLLLLLALGVLGLGAWRGEDHQATAAPGADPARSCGDFALRPAFPDDRRIKVAVAEGNVPCRVARRVLKDFYRSGTPGNPDDWIEEVPGSVTKGPWTCHGPETVVKCKKKPGARPAGKIRGHYEHWPPGHGS